MEKAISLRPAVPGDEPFLFQVYASTREDELSVTGWSAEQKDQFLRMQFKAQKDYYEANYPGAQFLIILFHGQPVGRLYIYRNEQEIRIMDIALLTAFRRRGIGSWLFKQTMAEAEKERRKVGIHVEVFNPAMQLYERLGFRKAEDKGVYIYLEWIPQSVQSISSGNG